MRFPTVCAVGLASFLLGGFPAARAEAPPADATETAPQEGEGEVAAPAVSAAAEEGETEQEGAPSPLEEAESEIRLGRRAPVIYRSTLDDRQSAAARAGDYTVDPDYRGFIPVPNTVVMVKFNAKPRVDFVGDSGDAGTDFRFVPALFPPSTNGAVFGRVPQDGWQFGANANGSQMIVDVQAPSIEGTPRFYYQNDFFGDNLNPMRYRLQHLYGEYSGFTAGFTYGVFEDPDAWPNTVDYEGPNAVIFARRAVGQYQREIADRVILTLSVEDPDIFVDTTGSVGATPRFRAPDAGFALEWAPADRGHVRMSTILRAIGVAGGTLGSQDAFGWGINTSGNLRVTSRDNIQFWFVYGEGVGGMGNDTSFLNSDAAFTAWGALEPLEYWSAMGALTHQWTPRWSSTATYGHVNLENTALQAAAAYHESQYASINVVYQVFKRVRVGLEGLYGEKQVRSGQSNDIFRIQAGVQFALFD